MSLPDVSRLPRSIEAIKVYGIVVLDPDGNVISWSEGAETVQGYSAAEVMGKPFAPLYGKQISKPDGYFYELLEKARELGTLEEEGWRQRKSKVYFWSILSITPIYDVDKNLVAYTMVSKDLTAKKLVGELPEITKSLDCTPVLASSNITWYRSINGECIYPELQWEHFTGQAWPEHQGFGWLKMYPEEEHAKVMAFWQSLQDMDISMLYSDLHAIQNPDINKKLVCRTKLWSKHHDSYRPVVISVIPLFNKEGEFKHWVGNEKDEYNIVAEKMRYEKLSEKHQLLLGSSKIGLWEYDIEKDYFDIDAIIAKFYGIDLDHYGHTLTEARGKIHDEDGELVAKLLKDCIENGNSYLIQFRIHTLDGTVRHIVEDGTPQYEDGKIKRIIGTNWDITDSVELRNARERAKLAADQREAQRKFIDSVCHEVKNPLNAINGYIERLLEVHSELGKLECLNEDNKQLLDSKRAQLKNDIEVIRDSANHQNEFLNQVLDLTELDKNRTFLHKQDFNLQSICRSVITMHQREIAAKHLSLEVNMPEEAIWVKSDITHFKRILINILLNAIHNTEAGSIGIEVKILNQAADKTKFIITIRDTSAGYTPIQLADLLERFSPMTRYSFAAKNKGPGLALVISNELSKLMGGHLEVTNSSGHGNLFKLTFEFDNGQDPAVAMGSPVPTSLVIAGAGIKNTAKTILVVDDGKPNRMILERLINKMGHKCIQAADGIEAVDAYDKFRPDLIFMDLEMPKRNGFEAAEYIRRLEGEIAVPIYAVSAYLTEEYREKAIAAGMNGFVAKPVDMKSIKDAVCSALNLSIETPSADAYTSAGVGAE